MPLLERGWDCIQFACHYSEMATSAFANVWINKPD